MVTRVPSWGLHYARPVRTLSTRVLSTVLLALVIVMPSVSVAAAQDARPGRGLARGHAKDVVIVGFEDGAGKAQRGKAASSVKAKGVRRISPLAGDTVVMKLPPGQSVARSVVTLRRQQGVAFAEPDYYVYAAETSNDTLYGDLWGMHGGSTAPSNPYGSNAAEAWAAGDIGSSDVFVAVLDEGIEVGHGDLSANIDVGRGWDFLSDDDSVYDGSVYWHGTHVAGTIGARGGNGAGVAGVNWRIRMISVKMLGPELNSGQVSETVAAIDYVTSLKQGGLDVVAINASWGYEGPASSALLAAVRRAGDAGLLFVAAAGNGGQDIDQGSTSFYPAAYDCSLTATGASRGWDCLISVANLTSSGGRAGDSNYGSIGVDLGAPGSSILSTYAGGYAYASGTSMAAPHVTGAVALCSSIAPAAGPAAIRDHILSTTVSTPSMSSTTTGGRLDIGAMADACDPSVPEPTPSPSPSPSPSPTPSPTPESATVVVDELSNRFVRKGTGWRAAAFGYDKHHFWSPTRSTPAVRIGKWKAQLAAPGEYRVKAKVPTRHASTRRAVYQVKTVDGWVKRVRNQYKARGTWVSLGVHRLATAPVVKLTDRTGESASLGRALAFDAVKFVPVSSSAAAGPSSPAPPTTRVTPPVAPAPQERAGPTPAPDAEPAPRVESEAPPSPRARPKPEATPALKATPRPQVESLPELTRIPGAKPDREAKSTPAPEAGAASAGALVVDPADLRLQVGGSQRLRAFVCPGDVDADEVNDRCTPGNDVKWSLEDPSAAKLQRRGAGPRNGKPKPTMLLATAPGETWLVARSGSLEARARLVIVPADGERAPRADD